MLVDTILSIHSEKAKQALKRIITEFDASKLSLESTLLAKIGKEYVNFYTKLSSPQLEEQEWNKDEVLYSSKIIEPFTAINEDLANSYEQVSRLRTAALNYNNLSEVERKGIEELTNEVKNKLASLSTWTDTSEVGSLYVSDSFNTRDMVDETNTTANVDEDKGYVELPLNTKEDVTKIISNIVLAKDEIKSGDLTILNGIPGNNLEISGYETPKEVENTIEGMMPITPQFVKETEGDKSNLASILDSNSDTWFEFEKLVVPIWQKLSRINNTPAAKFDMNGETYTVLKMTEADKSLYGNKNQVTTKEGVLIHSLGGNKIKYDTESITLDYGWNYQLTWPGTSKDTKEYRIVRTCYEDPKDKLTLKITIELGKATNLSWLEIEPYFINGISYYVDSVYVTKEDSTDNIKVTDKAYKLHPDLVTPTVSKDGEIPIKSTKGVAAIPCYINNATKIHITFKQEEYYQTQIAHEFGVIKASIHYSVKSKFNNSIGSEYSRTNLATADLLYPWDPQTPYFESRKKAVDSGNYKVLKAELDTYYDVFKAYRYAIGIRDIRIYNNSYVELGVIQSKAHTFSKPINKLELIVGEQIPTTWPKGEWIKYEVSVNGTTWMEIKPTHSGIAGQIMNIPETSTIYFRAVMKRPSDKVGETPILHYYTLKATPV